MDPYDRTENSALATLPSDDDPAEDQFAPHNPDSVADVRERLEERVDALLGR